MNRPTRICFLKRSFAAKGGLEKQARLIVEYFAKKGHEITLITETAPDNLPFSVIKTRPCSLMSFQKISQYNHQVKTLLKTQKFDHVFGFDRTEMQTIMRLGNGVHKSFLEQKKSFDPWIKRFLPKNPQDYISLGIEKRSFSSTQVKTVIANSHMVKDEVLKYYSIDPDQIHVIHNGVEWKENERAFYDQFNLHQSESNTVHILFAGHGFKRKGLIPLLNALFLLRGKNFHLHIVGEDKNRASFQSLSNQYGLSSQVTFYGKVTDTKRFFQLADLCIIPSYYDPFANVTVEALSFGIPVISSRKNGGHEIIKPFMGSVIDDLHDERFFSALIESYLKKKQFDLALKIRKEVEYLDFSNQLEKLAHVCLN